MANEQTMISTDMMSLDEQMELGAVTRWHWPMPLEQLSKEDMMELGFATMASWQEISPTEMQGFWAEALVGLTVNQQLHSQPSWQVQYQRAGLIKLRIARRLTGV